jgi:hypothetical protein
MSMHNDRTRQKTAAYHEGYSDVLALYGLEKEAAGPLAPAIGKAVTGLATRAIPALARGAKSLLQGARGAGKTLATRAPKTTQTLQGAGKVLNHPGTQVAMMMPPPK